MIFSMYVNFKLIDWIFLDMYHSIPFLNTSVIAPITDCEINYDPSSCNILIKQQIYVVFGRSINQNVCNQLFKQIQKQYSKILCDSNRNIKQLYLKSQKHDSWLISKDTDDKPTLMHDEDSQSVRMGYNYRFGIVGLEDCWFEILSHVKYGCAIPK